METQIRLEQVERKVLAMQHDNGLTEFAFGLLLGVVGSMTEAGLGLPLPLVVTGVVLGFRWMKKRVVRPRTGEIHFLPGVRTRKGWRMAGYLVLTILALAVLLAKWGVGGVLWLRSMVPLLLLGLLGIRFLGWGVFLPYRAFLVDGSILILAAIVGTLFDLSYSVLFVATSIPLMMMGLIRFVSFLKVNPRLVEEG